MAGDEAKEALQPFHSAERRCGLLARQGTGSLEDPGVHQPPVVHQVANGYLNVLTLGGGGERLGVDCGGLRGSGAKSRGGIGGRS